MVNIFYIFIGFFIGIVLMSLLRRLLQKQNRHIWVKTIKTHLLVQISEEIIEELKLRGQWQKG